IYADQNFSNIIKQGEGSEFSDDFGNNNVDDYGASKGVPVESEFDDYAPPAPKKGKTPADDDFIGPVNPFAVPKKDTTKKTTNKKDEKPKGSTIEVRKPKTVNDYE